MLYNVIHLHSIELTDLYIINVMHMLNLLCDIDIKLLLIQFFVQAEEIFSVNRTNVQILQQSAALTARLTVATETSSISLLPAELNTTNMVLSNLIAALESSLSNGTAPPNEAIVNILNNILDESNLNGWRDLQRVSPGSQVLLDNAERYALYLARSLNNTSPSRVFSRENIGMKYIHN